MNIKPHQLNIISFVGAAGAGKNWIADKAKMFFQADGHQTEEIVFAGTLKSQVARALPQDIIEKYGRQGDSPEDILENLKNNHPDVMLLDNLNARSLLQQLGTEYYRTINPNIHVAWVAQHIAEQLEATPKDVKKIFISSDNRFPNEQAFLLGLNKIKNKDDIIDYCRSVANSIQISESPEAFFDVLFKKNISTQNKEFAHKLKNNITEGIRSLQNTKKANKEWQLPDPKELNGLNYKAAGELGFINVFRPILPNDYNGPTEGTELIKAIAKFTRMDTTDENGNIIPNNELNRVFDYYKKANLEINLENIQKFGYLRADPWHTSERALDGMKPQPILNTPKGENWGQGIEMMVEALFQPVLNSDLKWKGAIKNKPEREFKIAFMLKSLFDEKALNQLNESHQKGGLAGLDAAAKQFSENNNLEAGIGLDFYQMIRNLKKYIPDEILDIKTGLVTKFGMEGRAPIIKALKNHGITMDSEFWLDGGDTKQNLETAKFDSVIVKKGADITEHGESFKVSNAHKSTCQTIGDALEKLKEMAHSGRHQDIDFAIEWAKQNKVYDKKITRDLPNNQSQYKEMGENIKINLNSNENKETSIVFDLKLLLEKNKKGDLVAQNGIGMLRGFQKIDKETSETAFQLKTSIFLDDKYSKNDIKATLEKEGIQTKNINFITKNEIFYDTNIDFLICDDLDLATEARCRDIPAVNFKAKTITNEQNKAMDGTKVKFFWDVDQVLIRDYEMIYQTAGLEAFKHIQNKVETIEGGPLLGFASKMGRAIQELRDNDKMDVKAIAVTARGAGASRYVLENIFQSCQVSTMKCLDGAKKMPHIASEMKEGDVGIFLDDYIGHFGDDYYDALEKSKSSFLNCGEVVCSARNVSENINNKMMDTAQKLAIQNAFDKGVRTPINKNKARMN